MKSITILKVIANILIKRRKQVPVRVQCLTFPMCTAIGKNSLLICRISNHSLVLKFSLHIVSFLRDCTSVELLQTKSQWKQMSTSKSVRWIKYNLIQKEDTVNEWLSLGKITVASMGHQSVSGYLVELLFDSFGKRSFG
jgi:hypothetical protein